MGRSGMTVASFLLRRNVAAGYCFSTESMSCVFATELARNGERLWATAEDMAWNKGRVLSLYRQLLRSLNSPDLPLDLAARLAKKAEVRAIFLVGSEERSLHNVEDLIVNAEYALSILRKGKIPRHIQ